MCALSDGVGLLAPVAGSALVIALVLVEHAAAIAGTHGFGKRGGLRGGKAQLVVLGVDINQLGTALDKPGRIGAGQTELNRQAQQR
ncbi:hypothetical protein D3C81_1214020 [compost metagenome]